MRRIATIAALTATFGLGFEFSATAQFAPSGGALLHSEEAAKPPPGEVVTEPPAGAEEDAAEE